jgi:hypothetical protein
MQTMRKFLLLAVPLARIRMLAQLPPLGEPAIHAPG